eukprot:CAMPEP_0113888712 /NCGR_PEP_ID=MMETSP0780_2-20120614/13036_1 /TAXON_ID=652834 /ORGANISM="Palpitomonas bilix" /LENGTH=204 /DNA_ID=CAMNT_0000877615 /DNA_START=256 /DNA_END=867 /DNA_ORIENTATION=+ /assembly_acc=CAM_ASM_000599
MSKLNLASPSLSASLRLLSSKSDSAEKLDEIFALFLEGTEEALHQLSRAEQIRARKWMEKLEEEAGVSALWKKNRNAYALLLMRMTAAGELFDPFQHQPDNGPLPTLAQHLALSSQIADPNDAALSETLRKTVERLKKTEDGSPHLKDINMENESGSRKAQGHNGEKALSRAALSPQATGTRSHDSPISVSDLAQVDVMSTRVW